MKVGVVIPAAGSGTRMGGAHKAFLEIAGKPLLAYCLEAFHQVDVIHSIIVVLPEHLVHSDAPYLKHSRVGTVKGGAQRADSVRAGLEALDASVDTVVVHDAARPLVTPAMIEAVLAATSATDSATLALPVTDTLHCANAEHIITETPDRALFWRALTPQAFPRSVLTQAYQRVIDASSATDEAGLVARAGFTVRVVPGDPSNIKVTTPADLPLAEAALARMR
jgi:2-C-methyl-D-erythritol 4-phosphate cytidylyltransferase